MSPKPIFDNMRGSEEEELPKQPDGEREPTTLWDMFMEYVKNKDKKEKSRFLETVE
jgi:hypothetical protein